MVADTQPVTEAEKANGTMSELKGRVRILAQLCHCVDGNTEAWQAGVVARGHGVVKWRNPG